MKHLCDMVYPLASLLTNRVCNLLLHIFVSNASLHRIPRGNAIDPLQQMRERLHLLFRESSSLPAFHPWPSLNICHRIFAFAGTGEVFARTVAVDSRKTDFENAVDAEGFVLVAVDCVCSAEKLVGVVDEQIGRRL